MTPHQLTMLDWISTSCGALVPAERKAVLAIMAERAELINASVAIINLWDEFMADEGCTNPLDYPIDDRIRDLRAAAIKTNGGQPCGG